MNGATTIQERLKDLRLNKGLKLEELAEQTGISKSALGSYEKDDYKEINHGNLILLADFYGVSLDYLFCRTENRAEINTPLSELHLSDEMVALLKSGRINNRLLCELATHKDFIKFLADIEIYVDGIATMQIQNLNALVDTVRHEIIERYRPGEDDPHLKVLQAAHISDDEYFSHIRELKKYKQILRMVVTTRRILCFADTDKRAAVVFSIAVVSRFLCQNSPIACKHAAAGFFK